MGGWMDGWMELGGGEELDGKGRVGHGQHQRKHGHETLYFFLVLSQRWICANITALR